jgi:hypothetical protein
MEKIRFLLAVKIRIILISSPVDHDFSTAFSNNQNLLILQFSSNFLNLLFVSFLMNNTTRHQPLGEAKIALSFGVLTN